MIAKFFNDLDAFWYGLTRPAWAKFTHLVKYYCTEFTFGIIVISILFLIILAVVFRSGWVMAQTDRALKRAEKRWRKKDKEYEEKYGEEA